MTLNADEIIEKVFTEYSNKTFNEISLLGEFETSTICSDDKEYSLIIERKTISNDLVHIILDLRTTLKLGISKAYTKGFAKRKSGECRELEAYELW